MKNNIVFITGASSGIGKACAEEFAKHGTNVLLCARRLERVQQLASQLASDYKIKTHAFALDVTDRRAVEHALVELPAEWRSIDVLLNNAGLAVGIDKLQDADVDDWERMINTNVKGLLYVTRAILPGMLERQRGHVIQIGSTAGHEAYTGGSVYCATKHAVDAINKALKQDLHGTPIRVSSVDPGATETEFSQTRFKGDQSRAKQVYQGMTPLSGKDIAEVVYFCASRPQHVNILDVIMMPTDQSSSTMIHRRI